MLGAQPVRQLLGGVLHESLDAVQLSRLDALLPMKHGVKVQVIHHHLGAPLLLLLLGRLVQCGGVVVAAGEDGAAIPAQRGHVFVERPPAAPCVREDELEQVRVLGVGEDGGGEVLVLHPAVGQLLAACAGGLVGKMQELVRLCRYWVLEIARVDGGWVRRAHRLHLAPCALHLGHLGGHVLPVAVRVLPEEFLFLCPPLCLVEIFQLCHALSMPVPRQPLLALPPHDRQVRTVVHV
mmetsp:Transcript_7756/g.15848  ORF Transcript_7756/g.15848 Transcript_7756/m.15848 type:complete len:237 (-) Transcript_7756:2806-3516(-)